MTEIWKDIEGYDGFYQVSNFGRIKSLYKNKETMLKPQIVSKYYMVKLSKNGIEKHRTVHSLVAQAFVDDWFENAEINHKDSNKLNNRFDNLEWVTRSENQKHQYYKRYPDYKKPVCEKCGKHVSGKEVKYCLNCSKLEKRKNWPDIIDLSNDLKNMNFTQIGKKYGYSDNMIRKICKAYGLPYNVKDLKKYRDIA